MGYVLCLEDERPAGVRVKHAWRVGGLDIVGDLLAETRVCVWCEREEYRGHGAISPKSWRVRS